jgi:hypothetical protein
MDASGADQLTSFAQVCTRVDCGNLEKAKLQGVAR